MSADRRAEISFEADTAFLRPMTDDRIKSLWNLYGPQDGEDPITRSLHDWDFLLLLVEVAKARGVVLPGMP